MLNLIFVVIAMLVVFGGSVRAEELGSAPGWQLNRVQEQKADNDFTYSDGRVFFSLKPPDARPAITVDNRTADRLRSGEVGAEATYTGQTRGLAQGKDEEFVYGSKSNGLVLAEPILSTLTAADGGRIDASVPVAAEPPPRAAGSESSSLSGLSSGSSGIGGRTFASAATNRPRNTSGASAPAPAAAPAAAAAATGASGPPPVVDPRLAIAEANRNAPPPKAGTFQGGVSAANEAGGFGIKKKDKDGKSKEDENFIVWPNGEPDGKTDGKAKCGASVYKLYDQASVVRLQAPEGCQNMRVRAWGAGGGGGGYDDEGTQTGGKGGGGAFVYTAGLVDTKKFDVVIVIGEAGAAGHGKSGGVGGSIGGGGKGGSSAGGLSGGGGAGGGYSGVFLLERAKVSTDEKKIDPELAIVIAAGGGGGSSSGDNGGGGGITRGGGNGATQSSGGPKNGNSEAGESLKGGAGGEGGGVNNSGGGGGGGLFGGGGGGAASQMDGPSIGGGGGSSFYRYLDNFETATADGPKAGNQSFKDRGTSGDAGKPGKVIIEFY